MPTLVVNLVDGTDPAHPGAGEVIAILPDGVEPGLAEAGNPHWRLVETREDEAALSILIMPGNHGRYRKVRLDADALPELVRIENPSDNHFEIG